MPARESYFRTNTRDPACCGRIACMASFGRAELVGIEGAFALLSTAMESTPTIGADVGGTKLLLGVLKEGLEVASEATAPTTGMGSEELLDTLEDRFRQAIESNPGVAAIGLGLPCTIDRERGVAISAVNLDIVDVPVKQELMG